MSARTGIDAIRTHRALPLRQLQRVRETMRSPIPRILRSHIRTLHARHDSLPHTPHIQVHRNRSRRIRIQSPTRRHRRRTRHRHRLQRPHRRPTLLRDHHARNDDRLTAQPHIGTQSDIDAIGTHRVRPRRGRERRVEPVSAAIHGVRGRHVIARRVGDNRDADAVHIHVDGDRIHHVRVDRPT